MRLLAVLFSSFAILHSSFSAQPNFLLVMADDMGFSDLGCYGSEIETPNMDKLAANGLRFSQFYNTAKCHSSRVSLLSGRWCRQAGDTALKRAVIIPEVLAPAGYFTSMTGKWHLDKEPTDFGFQRYFGHLSGATNYFHGDKTFRLNGQPFNVPEQGFYTTIANVDHALKFIAEARAAKKPWFHYIAFNAPHAPLQPLEQDFKNTSVVTTLAGMSSAPPVWPNRSKSASCLLTPPNRHAPSTFQNGASSPLSSARRKPAS